MKYLIVTGRKTLLILLFALTSNFSYSQLLDFCGRYPYHQASSSNPDSIRYDRFGNSYDIGMDDAANDPNRVRESCGYFEITYSSVPQDFRNRICDVFNYLTDLIDQRINISICGDTILPQPVLISIKMDSLKPGVLGVASPDFYTYKSESSCFETYSNQVYDKINGSVKEVNFPQPDGRITITNDTTIKWYTGTGNTPDGLYDLYSLVLHEAGHLLAFASLIDTSGPVNGISLWDQFLFLTSEYLSNGQTEFTAPMMTSDCMINCWSLNDSLFSDFGEVDSLLQQNCSLNGDLDFVFGQNAIAPIVGGPLEVNNLSHLNPNCNSENIAYVMQRTIGNDTILNQRRNFTESEIEILCALGYKTNSCDGCYVSGMAEEPVFIDDLYFPTIFHGCINDTLTIAISDLLCNDFTNGDDIIITNWAIPNGIDIVHANDSVKFVSSISNKFTIRYTIKGCECNMFNFEFHINIGPCYDCTLVDPCENLTCANGFEQFTPEQVNYIVQNELSDGEYWVFENSNSNTIDVCEIDSNTYINIAGFSTNLEGISLKLSEPIKPGCKMHLNLRASGSKVGTVIRIQGSEFPPCNFEDSRISVSCIPTNCDSYLYNPICIDTIKLNNLHSAGLCSSNPNLQPKEIVWFNNDSFDINYVLISPMIDNVSLKVDDIVIQKSCFDPCFNYAYLINCADVSFSACEQDSMFLHFWDFGDDSISTDINPIHSFLIADTFTVTHIIQDLCGFVDTSILNVIVSSQVDECCPDTIISSSTTWDSNNLPNNGRFHTITVTRGVAFTINDDVELRFCEGGALIIEPGAYVDLEGDLTSYGDMTWKGVYVGGDSASHQGTYLLGGGFNGRRQGFLETRRGASIKNAEIAIRNYGKDGSSTSGGMIRCKETLFQNNTVGVDFIEYQNFNDSINQPLTSLGSFNACRFYTDTAYFLNYPFYAFARISKVDGLDFKACKFVNTLLPEIPSQVKDFGFGIQAVDAEFKVHPNITTGGIGPCPPPCSMTDSTLFSGLGHGIYVMTEFQSRPYSIYNTLFENCFRGVTDITRGGATILYNTFSLGEVPSLNFSHGQIGAEFHFAHDGFTLQENRFVVNDEQTEVIPIGTLCNGLGEFDNEIRRNTFIGVETANQAFSVNRDNNIFLPRGLRYFCNNFQETPSQGYDFHIPETPDEDLIHPFQTPGSSQGSNISTGNHFAYSAQDFINYGEGGLNYWYYPPGNNEEPRDSFSLGIGKFEGDSNTCEVIYCAPPCLEDVENIKEDFINHLDNYDVSLDNYLDALISENQSKIDSARSKALYYRRLSSQDAYTVLQHLMIDTLEYNTDSLIKWMGHLETYNSEAMIAGEYASTGDFVNALDVLETINSRRNLSIAENIDLSYLIDIYTLLDAKPLYSFTSTDRTFLRNVAYQNIGVASGISRALLFSFGEYIPLPYYHGKQINFRNVAQDTLAIFLSNEDQILLKVYPNPTSGYVTIEWDEKEFNCGSLSVYNLLGENVIELKGNIISPLHLDVYLSMNGMHWIIARDSHGKTISGKFILQKNR